MGVKHTEVKPSNGFQEVEDCDILLANQNKAMNQFNKPCLPENNNSDIKDETTENNITENEVNDFSKDTDNSKNKNDFESSHDESDEEIGYKKKKVNASRTSNIMSDSEDESDSQTNKKPDNNKKDKLKPVLDSSDEDNSDNGNENNDKINNKLKDLLDDDEMKTDRIDDNVIEEEMVYSEDKSSDIEKYTNINGENESKTNINKDVSSSDDDLNLNRKDEKPGKKKKPGRLMKNELKEMKSVQQRMLRERSCEIPYHEPKAKSVKEFLKRVPALSNRRTRSLQNTIGITLADSEKKKSLFDEKPMLKRNDADLEFVDIDDVVTSKVKGSSTRKSNNPLDNFMKKVERHIVKKTPIKEKAAIEDTTPVIVKSNEKFKNCHGIGHLQLKSQLKEKIRQARKQQHNELQSQRDKLEEQIALEEESFGEDEMDSDDSDDENDSDDDEEVDKWNREEGRIRLEELMAEENENEGEEENKDEKEGNEDSVDFNIDENAGENEDSHLEEKSGKVLTQLLKSNILDTTTDRILDEQKTLSLPCENTQDLYKTESRVSSQECDSDTELGPNFRLSLDEESQFTQSVLDSQGFFKSNRKEESTPIMDKQLFSNDMKQIDAMSMTQMIGLCSGKFDDDTSSDVTTSQKKDGTNNKSLNISLGFDQSFDVVPFFQNKNENSSQDSEKQPTKNLSEALQEAKNNNRQDDKMDGEGGVKIVQDNKNKEATTVESYTSKNENNEDFEGFEAEGKEIGSDELENEEQNNDDEENEGDEDNEDIASEEDGEDENEDRDEDVPEELKEWNQHINNEHNEYNTKKKWKKKAFYENEAELSGSDVGSDDEDLGSEYDEYEIDSEAEQDVLNSDKLKKQLHKIHQRKMNDQDKREMRLLQELYLEDGEFGGDEKRKRNFRWRNIDENFNENSASYEVDDGDNYSELKERNQNLVERNKFLLEQGQENAAIELDENSQMILEKIQAIGSQKPATSSQPTSSIENSQNSKVSFRRSGSFLHGSDLSQSSSSVPAVSKTVGKSAKSFVYQALDDGQKSKPKKTKNELGEDVQLFPPNKKQKLGIEPNHDKRQTAASSIFYHL